MKANELRIGNIVMGKTVDLETGDYTWQPIIINADVIKELELSETQNYLRPIHLTPELLEKWGFEKGCLTYFLNENWFLGWSGTFVFLQIERQDQTDDICERIEFSHCTSLHQLQNLFFALTGKELIPCRYSNR